jgi:hypothetical protein
VRGLLGPGPGGGGLQGADGVVEGRPRPGRSRPVCVVVGGVGSEVDVVGVATTGHADVEVFAVESRAGEQDAEVGGGALGAVDGARPAVGGVLGEVRRRELGVTAAGEVPHEQAAARGGA